MRMLGCLGSCYVVARVLLGCSGCFHAVAKWLQRYCYYADTMVFKRLLCGCWGV